MSIDEIMQRAVATLRPVVEATYGPLPPTRLVRMDNPTPYPSPLYLFPHKEHRQWRIHYHPSDFKKQIGSRSALVGGVIHELLHFYGIYQFQELVNSRWEPEFDHVDLYRNWGEGVTRLAEIHLRVDIIRRGTASEIMAAIFDTRRRWNYARQFEQCLVEKLGWTLTRATQLGRLSQPSAAKLEQIFQLTPGLSQKAEKMANRISRQAQRATFAQHYAYAVGSIMCGEVVKQGKMTLADLMRTPINNQDLNALAA